MVEFDWTGNTPLIRINSLSNLLGCEILVSPRPPLADLPTGSHARPGQAPPVRSRID